MMEKEFFGKSILGYIFNLKNDRMREASGYANARMMYRSLARRLVDRQDWSLVMLYDGTQNPLLDAIEYLARIRDTDSIPRLQALFLRYSEPTPKKAYDGSYGPDDREPKSMQSAAAAALLALYPEKDAKTFVTTALADPCIERLTCATLSHLTAYAEGHDMHEIATLLLTRGKELKAVFEGLWAEHTRNPGRSMILFDSLYGYQELVYAAYTMAWGWDYKMEALDILVAEFNHPDASYKARCMRPHEHTRTFICEILDSYLFSMENFRKKLVDRLEPDRLKTDLRIYQYEKANRCAAENNCRKL